MLKGGSAKARSTQPGDRSASSRTQSPVLMALGMGFGSRGSRKVRAWVQSTTRAGLAQEEDGAKNAGFAAKRGLELYAEQRTAAGAPMVAGARLLLFSLSHSLRKRAPCKATSFSAVIGSA